MRIHELAQIENQVKKSPEINVKVESDKVRVSIDCTAEQLERSDER